MVVLLHKHFSSWLSPFCNSISIVTNCTYATMSESHTTAYVNNSFTFYCLLVERHCAELWHCLHTCVYSLVPNNKFACLFQERKWALILLSRVWVMEHGVGIQCARKFEQNVETRYSVFKLLTSTSYCLSLLNWIFMRRVYLKTPGAWSKLKHTVYDALTFVEVTRLQNLLKITA